MVVDRRAARIAGHYIPCTARFRWPLSLVNAVAALTLPGKSPTTATGPRPCIPILSMRPSPSPTEPHVARLFIYPIKSCAGIELPTARLTETGLAHGLGQTLRVGQALELDYGFE